MQAGSFALHVLIADNCRRKRLHRTVELRQNCVCWQVDKNYLFISVAVHLHL